MISINVLVDHAKWNSKITRRNFFFNRIIKYFPSRYRLKNKNVYLTFLLSNNKKIQKLNLKFRKKNKPTDILSFPLNKKIGRKLYLGDIIISYQFINKPKFSNNLVFKKKLVRIFIHGFLHLLGYDHKKNKDYVKMNSEENKIFNLVEDKIAKIN